MIKISLFLLFPAVDDNDDDGKKRDRKILVKCLFVAEVEDEGEREPSGDDRTYIYEEKCSL